MCLPSSGPISISQIRNEIVTGGCGSSTYSLSALASLAGFPSDPDAMSEFYNYCCSSVTTTTTAPPTTTTTTVAAVCHDFIATATGFMVWIDCCGVNQNQFLIVGDTFCAQVGTVSGSYLDQGTTCNC